MSTHRFQYWASCPDFSSGEIIHYVTDPDRSRRISYRSFARNVDLTPLREVDHPALYRMSSPDNWAISFHRSKLPNGQTVYYFDWSRIEHMFLDPEEGWPSNEEMVQMARDLELSERQPSTRRENPTMPRLRWIAEQYPFPVVDQVIWTLSEALGIHHDFVVEARKRTSTSSDDVGDLLQISERVFPENTRYDRYLPWVAREVNALYRSRVPVGRDDEWNWLWVGSSAEHQAAELTQRFRSVVDWAEAERVDLGRYRWDQALDAASQWSRKRRVGQMPQGDVVYRWEDGWTVQQLATQEQLEAEGDVMQHCLSSYSVEDGNVLDPGGDLVLVFSLRDPKGLPHATMEFSSEYDASPYPYVAQLRGKQNAEPKPEYLARMVEFRTRKLPMVRLERVDPPPHAEDVSIPLVGAFRRSGEDVFLVYDYDGRGIVLAPHDLAAVAHRFEDETVDIVDGTLRREAVAERLGRWTPWITHSSIEPWMAWSVLEETGGRVKLLDGRDEMVEWMSGASVDPTVCRPFAQRAGNVGALFQRLVQ